MIWHTSGSGEIVHTVVVDVGQLAGALVGGRWHLGSDGGRQLVQSASFAATLVARGAHGQYGDR